MRMIMRIGVGVILLVIAPTAWCSESGRTDLILDEAKYSKTIQLYEGKETLKFVLVDIDEKGVALREPYFFSVTECPQWVWLAVSPNPPKGYDFNDLHQKDAKPNQPKNPDLPINNVGAAYVEAFLDGLNQKIPGFRLPYESEWITAAMVLEANKNLTDERLQVGMTLTDQPFPHLVGFQQSGPVLFDMFSNVAEMCMPDPSTGFTWPNKYSRRGGAWNSSPDEVGIDYKIYTSGTDWMQTLGFRLVIAKSKIAKNGEH